MKRILFFTLFATVAAMSFAQSATVEELVKQADAYFENKQYVEAFSLYKQAAEQGHAVAQCNLGFCYKKGYGVTTSRKGCGINMMCNS